MKLSLNQPDYSHYSLEELNDALANIDQDAFPERTQIIIKELSLRQNERESQKSEFVPLVEDKHPNWFIRYWRGQVSLPMSYWGVGLAVALVTYAVTFLVKKGIDASNATWHMGAYILFMYAFIGLVVLWQSVGLFRTAIKHPQRTGDSGWATVALLMLGIGLLSFSFSIYKSGVPAIKSGIQLLFESENEDSIDFRVLNDGRDLELIGRIEVGSNKLLVEQLKLHPNVKRIHLHSHGGRILAAKRMMETIKQYELETYVKTECASACTLLFLAGKTRLLAEQGSLKFHAPGLGGTSTHDIEEFSIEMKRIYEQEKLPSWFVRKVMGTPNDTFWVPTYDELTKASVIDKVVDPDVYPMSGLGPESSITAEAIESGFLKLEHMVAMKQFDPEAYDRAIKINLNGMLNGKNQNAITAEFNHLLYTERLPVYLSNSSDAAIVEYWKSQIAHMKSLRDDFPLACASLSFPDEVPEEKRYGNDGAISNEQQARDISAIASLIRTSQKTRIKMEKERQRELIQQVLSIVRSDNEEYISVVSSAKEYVEQPTLLCDASIALNEAFVSFDVATSGQLLRSL